MSIRRRKSESRPDILARIVECAEGACACGTKQAELSWHHPNCLWRVLSEAAFEIERLRKIIHEAAALGASIERDLSEAKPVTGRKKSADRRQTNLMLPVKGGKEGAGKSDLKADQPAAKKIRRAKP